MQKKHNKEEIIEVGQELFRKRGFNNTGIDDILKASGTPKGSFYNFFKSKEEFGVEVLKHYTDRQYNYVKDLLENFSLTPLPRLKAFYNALIKGNLQEGCRYGCLVGNMTQEMGGISDQISSSASDNLGRITTLIGECIKEGQEKTEIRDDYSAEELADFVHNSFYGAIMRSKAGRREQPFQLFFEMIFSFLKK